jgi:hypothetical protein
MNGSGDIPSPPMEERARERRSIKSHSACWAHFEITPQHFVAFKLIA